MYLFCLCLKQVFTGYSIFRRDINIFLQPLFRHFSFALRFEYYLHNDFNFCFQLFRWIISGIFQLSVSIYGKSYLSKLCKKFRKIIVKAFFISTVNEGCLNPIHMQKNLIFIPQQLLKRLEPYLLMHLITVILTIMTSFLTLSSYYLKV